MSFNAQQQSLLEELSLLDDPQERLAAAVDRIRRRPALGAEERRPEFRVRGCISQVWLIATLADGRCHFRADGDSPLVRALVLLLVDFFDGSTPTEILALAADPLEQLGLTRQLSPTRRNGLAAVRAAIRAFAENSARTKANHG